MFILSQIPKTSLFLCVVRGYNGLVKLPFYKENTIKSHEKEKAETPKQWNVNNTQLTYLKTTKTSNANYTFFFFITLNFFLYANSRV